MKSDIGASLRDVLAFPIAPKADFGKCARLNVVSALCPTNDINARRQLLVAGAAYALAEIERIDSQSGAPQIEAAE
jgi:hypothetical protein